MALQAENQLDSDDASAASASVFLADELQLKTCLLKYLQGPCKSDPPSMQMAAWVFLVDSFCIEPSDLALFSSSYHVSRKAKYASDDGFVHIVWFTG